MSSATRNHSGLPERGASGGRLHPVVQFAPNPWGLHDIYGLVWEWCAEGYAPYTDTPATDPVGPPATYRVIRGGSCVYPAVRCRSAGRNGGDPGRRWVNQGLRVLLPAPAD